MRMKIVALYDRVAEAFGQPQFGASTGAFVRSFNDEINRNAQDNALFQHPVDFELWLLGEYDDQDGTFMEDRRVLARGSDAAVKVVPQVVKGVN